MQALTRAYIAEHITDLSFWGHIWKTALWKHLLRQASYRDKILYNVYSMFVHVVSILYTVYIQCL